MASREAENCAPCAKKMFSGTPASPVARLKKASKPMRPLGKSSSSSREKVFSSHGIQSSADGGTTGTGRSIGGVSRSAKPMRKEERVRRPSKTPVRGKYTSSRAAR